MVSLIGNAAIHFYALLRCARGKLNTGNADQRYHRFMSETPPTGHPSAPGPAGYPPAMPPAGPWGPPPPMALSRPARWPMFVMLLITLVAVAAAVAAWLRPIPHEASGTPPAPTYSAQQVSDAKSKVCAAYAKVQNAVSVNVARTAGDDPNSQLLLAVNARQVFAMGSAYLMTTLAEEPATPADLAGPANDLAHLYQVMVLDGLVGDRNDPAHNAADQAGFKIQGLCK
jgi:hypothetical protein